MGSGGSSVGMIRGSVVHLHVELHPSVEVESCRCRGSGSGVESGQRTLLHLVDGSWGLSVLQARTGRSRDRSLASSVIHFHLQIHPRLAPLLERDVTLFEVLQQAVQIL